MKTANLNRDSYHLWSFIAISLLNVQNFVKGYNYTAECNVSRGGSVFVMFRKLYRVSVHGFERSVMKVESNRQNGIIIN